MKTIEEAAFEILVTDRDGHSRWEDEPKDRSEEFRRGTTAVILHALDMLHKAGVSPDTAAIRLRRGDSLEQICEPKERKPPVVVYVCPDDCKDSFVEDTFGSCIGCGKTLTYQSIMSLNLLGNGHRNTCNRYIRAKRAAESEAQDGR